VTYRSSAPVEADLAELARPGLASCVGRVLQRSLPDAAPASFHLQIEPRLPDLGDVQETSVGGTWGIEVSRNAARPSVTLIHLVTVFVLGTRAEIVLVFDKVGADVPPGLVRRLAAASAQQLEALVG